MVTQHKNKLENVAVNDVLPVKAARRDAIANLKQEALLLQRNRATRYVSWNIMAVF